MNNCKCGNRKTRLWMCNDCYSSLTEDQKSEVILNKLTINRSPPIKVDWKHIISILLLVACLIGFIVVFIILDNLIPWFKGVYSVLAIVIVSGLLFILFSNK